MGHESVAWDIPTRRSWSCSHESGASTFKVLPGLQQSATAGAVREIAVNAHREEATDSLWDDMRRRLLELLVDPHTDAPLQLVHDTGEELLEEGELVSDSGARYLVASVPRFVPARSRTEQEIAAYEDLVGP